MGRLSKDKRDVYYREAKKEGWRARSAFKLLQIDSEIDLLSGVRNVADLCAAPGGWSQVLAWRLLRGGCAADVVIAAPEGGVDAGHAVDIIPVKRQEGVPQQGAPVALEAERPQHQPRIVAVDKFEMQPIDGVVQVQGDITHASTVAEVLSHFCGELADLVVCDGAPDVTGRADFDEYVQHQLLLSELHLAMAVLRPGGTFVAKVFRGEHAGEIYGHLARLFGEVLCCKPRASRNSSVELFVVARGFAPACTFDRSNCLYTPARHEELAYLAHGAPTAEAPFVACGAAWGLDADRNYPVEADHKVLGPLAPPIAAPYANALDDRRRGTKRVASSPCPSAALPGDA